MFTSTKTKLCVVTSFVMLIQIQLSNPGITNNNSKSHTLKTAGITAQYHRLGK